MIDNFRDKYFFLSNFYASPFVYNNRAWKTVEHAFQAAKCVNSADVDKIHAAEKPGETKRIGRKVKLRPDWEDKKVGIMLECLEMKFTQNEALMQRLLDTGDKELIEGNTWGDDFWGCIRGTNGAWSGKNYLGKLLMEIRDNARNDK